MFSGLTKKHTSQPRSDTMSKLHEWQCVQTEPPVLQVRMYNFAVFVQKSKCRQTLPCNRLNHFHGQSTVVISLDPMQQRLTQNFEHQAHVCDLENTNKQEQEQQNKYKYKYKYNKVI
jgi:hypothetical protein